MIRQGGNISFLAFTLLLMILHSTAAAHNYAVALAYPIDGIIIDGILNDWPEDMRRYPITFVEFGDPIRNSGDFDGSFRIGYDARENALYVAIEVRDESGIIRYDGMSFQSLAREDGLPSEDIAVLIEDKNGDIWIGTVAGVVRYHRSDHTPPLVSLIDIITDRRHGPIDSVRLPSTQSLLAFEYRGHSFKTRPGGMVYRYRLKGHQTQWQTTYSRRVAYCDLPRGDYTFELQAIDRDLSYTENPIQVAVAVHPPYRLIGAWSAVVVAVSLGIWEIIRVCQRSRRLRAARDELELGVEQRTSELTMSNLRLIEEVTERERHEKLAGIQRDLAIKLSATTKLEDGLYLCLEAAIYASEMDCGGIYLVNEYSRSLELAAHQKLSAEFIKSVSHYDVDSDNVKLVMKGEPVYTEHEHLGVILDQAQKNEDLRAIAVVPVLNEGRVIGCMNIASHVLSHIHAQSRLVLETIAAQIGSTVARLKTAEALRESEEKYRTLFESANDVIFALQVDGNNLHFKECNSRVTDMFGCRKEDIIGKSPVDFSPSIQPDGALSTERAAQLCAAALAGEPQHFEWKHCRLDGNEFDTEVTLNCIDIMGKTYLQAIVRDITERKKAEEVLQESENRYRTVVENAGEGIVVAQDGFLRFTNNHFINVMGYSEDELMSRPFIEFVHPDDRELVAGIHVKRIKGEEVPRVYEFRAIDIQGNIKWLENNGILIEWDGRPASLNFLRACVKRLSSWFKSMQHKIDHGHIDHCLTAIGQCFIIFTEPTVFGEPTKCSLHNPAFRENLKIMKLAPFNNLDDPIELLLCPFHKKTTITTIRPD